MSSIALVLVGTAFVCHGRRVQTSNQWLKSSETSDTPLQSLTTLLSLLTPQAAFKPTGLGARLHVGNPEHYASQRLHLDLQTRFGHQHVEHRSAAGARMMADAISFPELDGKEVRVGIIKARRHEEIGNELISGVKAALTECGVETDNIIESEVPDSFQLPVAVRFLAFSGTVDVIVPVGVMIKGDTSDIMATEVSKGLMGVSLQTGVPIILGLVTGSSEAEAKTAAARDGSLYGKSAVEMGLLRQSATGGAKKQFFLGFDNDGTASKDESKSETKDEPEKKKIGF